jgi:hypothetical protein
MGGHGVDRHLRQRHDPVGTFGLGRPHEHSVLRPLHLLVDADGRLEQVQMAELKPEDFPGAKPRGSRQEDQPC